MVAAEQALGVDGGDGGSVEALDQATGGVRGIDTAAAEQHQRALGVDQPVERLLEGGGGRCGLGQRRAARADRLADRGVEQVDGDLDMHRARTGAVEHGEGTGQHLAEAVRVEQGVAEARDAGHQLALAGEFVQPALAASQGVAAVDAGDHQHRHRVGQGLAHGGGDIGHAGAGDDEADAGLAGGAGVAVGHEAGALFVARGDVADATALVVVSIAAFEATVELDGVDAGDTEDGVHVVGVTQQADQQFSAGHAVLP